MSEQVGISSRPTSHVPQTTTSQRLQMIGSKRTRRWMITSKKVQSSTSLGQAHCRATMTTMVVVMTLTTMVIVMTLTTMVIVMTTTMMMMVMTTTTVTGDNIDDCKVDALK